MNETKTQMKLMEELQIKIMDVMKKLASKKNIQL